MWNLIRDSSLWKSLLGINSSLVFIHIWKNSDDKNSYIQSLSDILFWCLDKMVNSLELLVNSMLEKSMLIPFKNFATCKLIKNDHPSSIQNGHVYLLILCGTCLKLNLLLYSGAVQSYTWKHSHQSLVRPGTSIEYLIGESHETAIKDVKVRIKNSYTYEVCVLHTFSLSTVAHRCLHPYVCCILFTFLFSFVWWSSLCSALQGYIIINAEQAL